MPVSSDLLERFRASIASEQRTWVVTGVAGFIGSGLLEALLRLDQRVVGLDNFSTGHRANLEDIRETVAAEQWDRLMMIEGDIGDLATCQRAVAGADVVLHQAALGSVPRSLKDPVATNDTNIGGFLNMITAARDAHVRRFVYAASSSTYGDSQALPKVEDKIGKPLSPYAVTKYVNELYADVFSRAYGFHAIGLRYFNVFGARQDPEGAYAAVIPKWIASLMRGEACVINGDGTTSRDFCYIDNVIQANLLASQVTTTAALNQVYNVALGGRTTLAELFEGLRDRVAKASGDDTIATAEPQHAAFRDGDVLHSQASIEKAKTLLGYRPTHDLGRGLEAAVPWYVDRLRATRVMG